MRGDHVSPAQRVGTGLLRRLLASFFEYLERDPPRGAPRLVREDDGLDYVRFGGTNRAVKRSRALKEVFRRRTPC